MGSTQALRLPKEYNVSLPSAFSAIKMRKMQARDQVAAATSYNKEKDDRYSLELIRLVTITPGSITQENPAGLPAFSADDILDLELEDINYLTAAMTALNNMTEAEDILDAKGKPTGQKKPKYSFNF